MIIKKIIELQNMYFLDKPKQTNPMWTAILLCQICTTIKTKGGRKYQKRKHWIHSLEAPSKKLLETKIWEFSKRKDVKLLGD